MRTFRYTYIDNKEDIKIVQRVQANTELEARAKAEDDVIKKLSLIRWRGNLQLTEILPEYSVSTTALAILSGLLIGILVAAYVISHYFFL